MQPARDNPAPTADLCSIIFSRSGAADVHLRGDKIRLSAGQGVLVDGTDLLGVSIDTELDSVAVFFEKAWLTEWFDFPDYIQVHRIAATVGWEGALRATLAAITPETIAQGALRSIGLAKVLGTMTSLSYGVSAPATDAATSHQQALFRRIHSVMREGMNDPDLSPGTVAKTIGISKRYLHAILAAKGKTFRSELLAMRLRLAERQLRDPRLAGMSVSEIAFATGFVSPSHFGRCFAALYGATPKAYRKGALDLPREPQATSSTI